MKTAPKGQEFYFSDGTVVNSIGNLVKHIKEISPEQYGNHVNDSKNDFYNWIHDCINPGVAATIQGNVPQREIIEKLTGHNWNSKHKKKYKY